MNEYNQSVVARSLNAIRGWTSPVPPCLFHFMCRNGNGLQKWATEAQPETETSMPQVGSSVQSALGGQNGHAPGETLACREAAQSNARPERRGAKDVEMQTGRASPRPLQADG